MMKAYLDGLNRITVDVPKGYYNGITGDYYLRINGRVFSCTVSDVLDAGPHISYTLYFEAPFNVYDRMILTDRYGTPCNVRMRFIVKTEWFEEHCTSDAALGSFYAPDETVFRVWSPSAQSVFLELHDRGKTQAVTMKRQKGGVFEATVAGDLKHAVYAYIIHRNDETVRCLDPYALSSTANHETSAVIDMDEIRGIEDPGVPPAPVPVIYETNVRDLTSRSEYQDKGKFLSICTDEPAVTGMPSVCGYLEDLGITHVQFQPVHDYEGVDELVPERTYNWGYNPVSYLSLEGSYSTKPKSPYSRVTEFRRMITELHRHGLRVNIDMVFNHVFEPETNALELTCPYYYFRYRPDGTPSNGSFCGNDLDSERFMVRRLFLRAVDVLFGLYGVNGLRLDLMGILDVETVNMIREQALMYDSGALVYGEGWDMPTDLPQEKKAIIANEASMPGTGHFNDVFRDVIKGGTGDDRPWESGWLSGTYMPYEAVKNVLEGSPGIFSDPMHSINYLESHDNSTLWDKLKASCWEEDEILRKRQLLMIQVMVLAKGIPLLHAGMEYYAGKNGMTNSYCAGDEINGFDWYRCREEKDTVRAVSEIIHLRKSLDAGHMQVYCEDGIWVMDYGETKVFVNPDRDAKYHNGKEIPGLELRVER
ncbi:MAG: hypothetical protein IKF51_04990 [Solobacterium sp.]|nr:hypothetical protein [Solobacterium sp.]